MSGPIVLRDGTEIPMFPLGIAARMVLFESAIDAVDKPAANAMLVFAAVGFAWEAACAVEARVPVNQRSVPPIRWEPWRAHSANVYAYGEAVISALASEDVMKLRAVGNEILRDAWTSLQPPEAKVEEAAKNSAPEAATSGGSSGSASGTAPAP